MRSHCALLSYTSLAVAIWFCMRAISYGIALFYKPRRTYEYASIYTLAMVAHADGVGIKLTILCGSRDGPHQINAAQLKLLMGILCRHHILLDYITASWDATHRRLFSLAGSFWDRQFIGWKIGGIFGRTHNF